jgi:predicted deacetylase
LNLNKTAGMHGIEHDYKEFKNNEISQENLSDTIQMFDECFKYKPSIFKAPQLMLSEKNRVLLEKNNLKIKGKINQVIHKVYHCSDTGTFPNYLHDLL